MKKKLYFSALFVFLFALVVLVKGILVVGTEYSKGIFGHYVLLMTIVGIILILSAALYFKEKALGRKIVVHKKTERAAIWTTVALLSISLSLAVRIVKEGELTLSDYLSWTIAYLLPSIVAHQILVGYRKYCLRKKAKGKPKNPFGPVYASKIRMEQ